MKDLEKLIDEVNGSMAMEGMPLTQSDKDRIRYCAGNVKLVEKTIAELVKKHTSARDYDCDYSYEWDHKYCYPHSNVLINKLRIRDAEKLRIAEIEITSLRIANAKLNLIRGDFDLLHLRTIHKYIYEWAGEL